MINRTRDKTILQFFRIIIFTLILGAVANSAPLSSVSFPGETALPLENNPQVYNVDQSTWHSSLSEAVSLALPDEVLELYTAFYYEQVILDKALTIKAATGEEPVMDGTVVRSGTGLTINSTGVLVQGLTFTGYDYGIDILAAAEATITDCGFYGNAIFAVRNLNTGCLVEASGNWWGDATGPVDLNDDRASAGYFNPLGQGDAVSDGINYNPWIVDVTTGDQSVGLGIYNTSCANFEVRVTPNSDMSGYLTNLVFTVSWDATEPVLLQNFISNYNISFQYLETAGGRNYAVFAMDIPTQVTWVAGTEYTILTFQHDQGGAEFSTSDFDIAADTWAWENNAYYYIEYWGSVYTGLVYRYEPEAYLSSCNIQVRTRVLLQACFNATTGLMETDINDGGDLPLNQPFQDPPWSFNSSLSVTSFPPDAIDWIYMEIRDPEDPTLVLDKNAGILLDDGTIMGHDLVNYPAFDGVEPLEEYYLLLWQRNHLPVMTKLPVQIPNPVVYDFSDTVNFPPFGGAECALIEVNNDIYGMIAGDANSDGVIKYSGPFNDRAPILDTIVKVTGQENIVNTIKGYYPEDINMNNYVKYTGSDNDPGFILLNLITLTNTLNLNSVYECVVPGIISSLPLKNDIAGPLNISIEKHDRYIAVVLYNKGHLDKQHLDNVQFTIVFQDAAFIENVSLCSSPIGIEPQGQPVVNNISYYQTFAMVGWHTLPGNFLNGGKMEILSIPYEDYSLDVKIADDAFASRINGSYYVSLAGMDNTGTILKSSLGEEELIRDQITVRIFPNPSLNRKYNVDLRGFVPDKYNYSVYDLLGNNLVSEEIEIGKDTYVYQIDCTNFPAGQYILKITGSDIVHTEKIIIAN